MEIKIQTKLEGDAAEMFAASMARNHRTASGEAAYRIERSLLADSEIAEIAMSKPGEVES